MRVDLSTTSWAEASGGRETGEISVVRVYEEKGSLDFARVCSPFKQASGIED